MLPLFNCESVIFCLSKTPDWSNKEPNGQQLGRRKDRQGWQAERIDRRRNLGGKKEEQEDKERRMLEESHPASHGVKSENKMYRREG